MPDHIEHCDNPPAKSTKSNACSFNRIHLLTFGMGTPGTILKMCLISIYSLSAHFLFKHLFSFIIIIMGRVYPRMQQRYQRWINYSPRYIHHIQRKRDIIFRRRNRNLNKRNDFNYIGRKPIEPWDIQATTTSEHTLKTHSQLLLWLITSRLFPYLHQLTIK